MDNLQFLNLSDFEVKRGKKGNLLHHNLSGLSFVLFYSTKCPHCSEFLATFKHISHKVNNYRFVLVNLNKGNNMQIAYMSQQTLAPIDVVPFLVLYVDFKPAIRYQGKATAENIVEFLNEVYQRLEMKNTSFSRTRPLANDEVFEYKNGMIPYNLIMCDKESCFIKTGGDANTSSDNSCYKTNGEIMQECKLQTNNTMPQRGVYTETQERRSNIRRRN